jgi:hypothetical protein
MRVSYHDAGEVVVVSLWAGGLCRASFRLAAADTDRFMAVLAGVRHTGEPEPPAPRAEVPGETGSADPADPRQQPTGTPAADAGQSAGPPVGSAVDVAETGAQATGDLTGGAAHAVPGWAAPVPRVA